jgi:hypothetical protein
MTGLMPLRTEVVPRRVSALPSTSAAAGVWDPASGGRRGRLWEDQGAADTR